MNDYKENFVKKLVKYVSHKENLKNLTSTVLNF